MPSTRFLVGAPASRCRRSPSPALVVTALVGVYFLCTVVGIVVTPVMPFDRFDWPVVAALVCLGVVAGLRPARAATRSSVPPRPVTRAEVVAVGAAVLALTALAAAAAWTILYRVSWDAGVIRETTWRPRTSRGIVSGYFGLYPNNLPFLGLARLVHGAGSALGLSYASSFLAVNAVLLFVTMMSTWAGIRAVGSRTAGGVGIALVGFLVALSPWMLVGYTDMPAMAFLTAAAAATLWAMTPLPWRVRASLLAVAGASTGVAVAFKPMPVVMVVAFVLTCVLNRRDLARGLTHRRRLAGPVLVPVTAAITFLLVSTPLTAASHTSARDLAGTPPQTRLTWVASGSHEDVVNGSPSYGGYDGDLVRRTSGRGAAEQNTLALDSIREDFQRRGVSGTIDFYWHKNVWNWGDGMFWAYGEGHDADRPVLHPRAATPFVASWDRPYGSWWHLRSGVTTGVWIALLVLIGIGLLRRRSAQVVYLGLCLLGIAAFDEVFQARSRYVFAFVPLAVMTAVIAQVARRPELTPPTATAPTPAVARAAPAAVRESAPDPVPA